MALNELLLPDIAGQYQRGYAIGDEMKRARKAEQSQNMLTGLAPAVLAGDPEAFVQAAAISPEQAVKYDKAGEVLARQSAGLAKWMLDAYQGGKGDMAEVQRRYQESLPFLTKMANAHRQPPPGPTFDPASVPLMERFVAQYEARRSGATETPTGFRQFQMTAAAAGLKPGTPEYQDAANIALGRLGRASSAGFGFELVEGADGRKRLQRQNPRTGAVEIYDETTGDFLPVGGAPAASATAVPEPAGPVPAAQFMTSGGVPMNIPPNEIAAFQRAMEADARGEEYNIQIPPGGAPTVRTGANPSLVIGRRPEDEAAAVEAAKTQVQLGALPVELGMRTDAAIAQTAGTERAKAQVEREAQAPSRTAKAQFEIDRAQRVESAIDRALQQADWNATGIVGGAMSNVPNTDAYDLRRTIDEIKSNIGFREIQQMRDNSPTGGALGQVAIQELEMLQSTLGSLDQAQSAAQLRASLNRVKQSMQRWRTLQEGIVRESGGVSARSGKPVPGAVEDGYRFKGGNPADPNSWERL